MPPKKTKPDQPTKKRFSFRFRGKKNSMVSVESTKLSSAARLSHKPQINDLDLSYATRHLMLLIQHQVDAERIKVPASGVSWDILVQFNQEADLLGKKNLAKESTGIHHFSPHELQTVADRVGVFLHTHQPHNVVNV